VTGYVAVITYQVASKAKEIHEPTTFVRYVAMVVAEDGQYLNSWLRDRGYVDQGK